MDIFSKMDSLGNKNNAENWREQYVNALGTLMAEVLKNDTLLFSPLYIVATQLKEVTTVDPLVEPLVWQCVESVLEQFPTFEQQSDFPFLIEEEAVPLFLAAMTGSLSAIIELAHFYREEGLAQWAVKWYKIAAAQQQAEAIYWLGNFSYDGQYCPFDLAFVFTSYEYAAAANFPDGLNNLADMYLRGEYVVQNDTIAFELFHRAAKLGVAESMYTLGFLYENGRGVQQDMKKSNYWYHESAVNGDLFAINKMGHQAFEMNNGELAMTWYLQAAEKFDRHGEFNVGFCYESGIGVEVDIKLAKYWYKRAALQGDSEAKRRLNDL